MSGRDVVGHNPRRIAALKLPALIFAFAAAASGAVTADLSRYTQSKDFIVAQSGNLLTIDSRGEKQTRLRIVFNLADPERLIHEVSVAPRADASRAIILEDAAPAYRVYTGRRHGSWEDNYFDNPSTRPHEVVEYMGQLALKRCRVEETGGRLQVILGELRLGIFHGDVVFTLYAGSNLVKQEAVVSTEEASVAYYYDSWVTRCSTNRLKRLLWMDQDGHFQQHLLLSDIDLEGPHLKVRRRQLVAEGPGGSMAVFPPPHQYFFARDETINYGYVWYQLYRISANAERGDLFSFGIRQTPYSEEANKAPLVNAPPASEQHMSMFWYIGAGGARDTFERVSAYTHNDAFPALPGYQTFTSHYHLAAVMDWRRRNREPYTPEWLSMFKGMGIDIAHLMDFHTDGHAHDVTPLRLHELENYFALAGQLSKSGVLVIPGEELWEYFGGHWAILLPHPVYYFLRRTPEQPFVERVPPFGVVYRLGSPAEMLEMIHREHGLAWQTHPRTKGSAGFPDANKDKFFSRDAAWLGGAFKAMPSDYSSPRLGQRALNLLDDMNNWGQRKFLVGEVDVFKINHTHELYGHMNINYVKLANKPGFPDWSPLIASLQRGEFFVTTGEILIRGIRTNGVPPGGRAQIGPDSRIVVEADLEWTFPLNFVELVWGDGVATHRKLVQQEPAPEFGRERIRIEETAPGAKWARFAVWDIAADGAFTQPVRFDDAR